MLKSVIINSVKDIAISVSVGMAMIVVILVWVKSLELIAEKWGFYVILIYDVLTAAIATLVISVWLCQRT